MKFITVTLVIAFAVASHAALTHISGGDEFMDTLEKAGDKLVVVDFFATWCGPCKMIAPVLEKIQEEMKDKIIIVKADVDDNQELTEQYGVRAMPTFMFFKKMALKEQFAGANEGLLRDAINRNL